MADEMGLGKDIADHLFVGLSLRVQRYYWTTYGSSPKVYPWKLDEGDKKCIPEKLLVTGKFDVCVTSFEMAIKEKKFLRHFSWRYVIIDEHEARWIKNENSLLSKTMRLYACITLIIVFLLLAHLFRTIFMNYGRFSIFCSLRYLVPRKPLMNGSRYRGRMISRTLSSSSTRSFVHSFWE